VGKPLLLRRRWLWLTAIVAIAGTGLLASSHALSRDSTQIQPSQATPVLARVSALGRLAPEGEVVEVAPPTQAGSIAGARVDQLLVKVGDEVRLGQVVAVLDTQASRAASVLEAKAKVEVARAKLVQVQAGPKPEEVRAQEAVIRRVQADLLAAQEEFDRRARLINVNAVSKEEYTSFRNRSEQARAALEQSKAQLDSLKAIREVDVQVTQAELRQAEAGLAVAEKDLQNTQVRSPLSGRVLRIRARPGERVGDQGILDVGNTSVMQIVAEVYEEDVGKVRIGQTAVARVPTLGVQLTGVVVSKDLIVSRKVIFSNDPVADIDARVVEIHIRLLPADGATVAELSNARVEVVFEVSGTPQ
jgi:HlyD family secretion protein